MPFRVGTRRAIPGLGLGLARPMGEGLPALLEGYAFAVDSDGAYLTDENGAFLITEAA